MKEPEKLPLKEALGDWADMQAVIGSAVILVRDFTCYGDPRGIIVKVNGEEPDGIRNAYRKSAREIENDLAKVVPGYVKGAAIWQEGEYDYGYGDD
ncbi:MAG TPA: hypothetical protein VH593_25160 [Ktedonobacteraceae bacterium]|jgi:hypothetical protein